MTELKQGDVNIGNGSRYTGAYLTHEEYAEGIAIMPADMVRCGRDVSDKPLLWPSPRPLDIDNYVCPLCGGTLLPMPTSKLCVSCDREFSPEGKVIA
jgi:hypothetical protein